eukprot:15482171-Alexandrium_andersonii.AAC.3
MRACGIPSWQPKLELTRIKGARRGTTCCLRNKNGRVGGNRMEWLRGRGGRRRGRMASQSTNGGKQGGGCEGAGRAGLFWRG